MAIINVYHKDCLDGSASACAVKKYCKNNKLEYIPFPMKHNYLDITFDDLKEISIRNGDKVYFTDFCLRYDDMVYLLENTKSSIMVLDHHKGIEEDLKKLKEQFGMFDFIFNNQKSGAEITWNYLFDEVPPLVKNVADRDLWLFRYPDTKLITMYLYDFVDDIDKLSTQLYNESDAQIVGQILLQRQEKIIDDIFGKQVSSPNVLKTKSMGFVKVFNANIYKSELGNMLSLHFNEPVGIFDIQGDNVNISFRSVELQDNTANEFAKQFGGNGHKHASGCCVKLDYFKNNISSK